jgi:hypothetical protein
MECVLRRQDLKLLIVRHGNHQHAAGHVWSAFDGLSGKQGVGVPANDLVNGIRLPAGHPENA